MAGIQDLRAHVLLPNGKRLHTYANLYINARNTMMYKRKEMHKQVVVLRIDKNVLKLPTAIVADQNAASAYVRFAAGMAGLAKLDKETVFARSWNHANDQIQTWKHRTAMCCEVLIPDRVPAEYILGVYVSCEEVRDRVILEFPSLKVSINRDVFFG